MTREPGWGPIVLLVAFAASLLMLRACSAEAQDTPDDLALRRCLVAEADGHTTDYLPVLAVLHARADRVGSTAARVARQYCAALHVRHPSRRQALVLALPGGDGARGWARAWAATGEALATWGAGVRPACSPTQWAGRHDRVPRRWVRVDCGATANSFWRGR